MRPSPDTGAPAGSRELPPYLRALWDLGPRLATLAPPADAEGAPPQRPVLARDPAPSIHLPASWSGGAQARLLRRAAAAHLAAHLVHGHAQHERGRLKPIQLVLLGLLEDARVEWLAMQALPGLRALWLPWHTADAGSGSTFEALLQRLARSLIDPHYRDPHPWVHKARRVFFADDTGSAPALHGAEDLRRAASLLGNDVGQMRLPFNARLYAVEPAYRDDNSHLWADSSLPPSATPLDGEQAAPERGAGAQGSGHPAPAARGDREPAANAPQVRVAPHAQAADDAAVQAEDRSTGAPGAEARCRLYPEWDRLIARYRPRWCSVYETDAPAGSLQGGLALLQEQAPQIARLRSLLQAQARSGRSARPVRAAEGDAFHLNRLVDARISQRLRLAPDPRVYLRAQLQPQPLEVLLLADCSASTADRCAQGGSVLDAVKRASLVAAVALEQAGHRCVLQAFSSNTRAHVRMQRIKAAGEDGADPAVLARLEGLRSGWSTRLGAVLRHAAASLRHARRGRPLVLLVGDGQAHDVDVHDSRYLPEDHRRAMAELRRAGIALASLDVSRFPRDLPRAMLDCIAAAG